ncbi:hypothetical protein ACKTEK_06860 [Tepidamorphus sp. 3E244]|uniref:hypothetical protein n=1 Tax=Tepidamorphus sp. 3E244 TaxID=3385498 RepID=UPI0038FCBE0F
MTIRRFAVSLVAVACLLAGAFTTTSAFAQGSVRSQSAFVRITATQAEVTMCHGFGCAFESVIPFREDDMAKLRDIMAEGTSSAAMEREAIKRAVAYFEEHAAIFAGTAKDIAGNYTTGGDRSQLDCVDEARNSTRFLIMLEKKGLLRHHTVAKIEGRGNFLDTRYPHNSAVIKDKKTGVKWSVDSWMRHNGDIPEVMTLKRWFKEGYS